MEIEGALPSRPYVRESLLGDNWIEGFERFPADLLSKKKKLDLCCDAIGGDRSIKAYVSGISGRRETVSVTDRLWFISNSRNIIIRREKKGDRNIENCVAGIEKSEKRRCILESDLCIVDTVARWMQEKCVVMLPPVYPTDNLSVVD